jgi:hypothetical protein
MRRWGHKQQEFLFRLSAHLFCFLFLLLLTDFRLNWTHEQPLHSTNPIKLNKGGKCFYYCRAQEREFDHPTVDNWASLIRKDWPEQSKER